MPLNPDDIKNSNCISLNAVRTLHVNRALYIGERYRLKWSLFQGNGEVVGTPSITETEVKCLKRWGRSKAKLEK